MGACEAHNLEVVGSKPTFATCEVSAEISFWALFLPNLRCLGHREMKLVVGFACARTLLTLSKSTQHFAATQQQFVRLSASSRLSTFRCKATSALASASENRGSVGYSVRYAPLFAVTGTLMHLKEPTGETYSRYAITQGSTMDLLLHFKTRLIF